MCEWQRVPIIKKASCGMVIVHRMTLSAKQRHCIRQQVLREYTQDPATLSRRGTKSGNRTQYAIIRSSNIPLAIVAMISVMQ